MKKIKILILLALILPISACSRVVNVYTTTADKSQTMSPSEIRISNTKKNGNYENSIRLCPEVKYQEMDGFGVALTGSSCYNLLQMNPVDRHALLTETFDPIQGYGFSFIRISIGCSDFSLDEYTCCDEPGIENFSIHEYDRRDLFPVLQEILSINPNISILASPWTCPKWMKVNNLKELKSFDSWKSGQLNPKYYEDYALYFVKYIQAMKEMGFSITAITIQNEPLNRGNSASLYMTWQEQSELIKKELGPAFRKFGLNTRILVFDHNYNYDSNKAENFDQGQYPLKIYEDPEAAQYIDGAAYHAYGGNKRELMRVHEARTDKNLYFTEMSIGLWGNGYNFANDFMWSMREVCLGSINNFSKAVIMWNYLLDDKHGPDRPGGCNTCLGAIDIDSNDYATLTRNSHYYEIAHLSKVIKPGANRIKTEAKTMSRIYHSAFENPDGSFSLVLQNDGDSETEVLIVLDKKSFIHKVLPKSVQSYCWKL